METPDDSVGAECFRTAKDVKISLDRITSGSKGRDLIAVHDLTKADFLDEPFCDVEVFVENERDRAIIRQSGGERVEDCGQFRCRRCWLAVSDW